MKRTICAARALALALVGMLSAPPAMADELPLLQVAYRDSPSHEVVEVVDRGRVRIKLEDGEQWLRCAGILAPAASDADELNDFLKRLLVGERVHVIRIEERNPPADQPQAALFFRAPDGLCANLELVRMGYAAASDAREFAHGKLFARYERHARAMRKGIWAAADTDRPAAKAGAADGPAGSDTVYVTRTGSKYHRVDCPHARASGQPMALAEARKKYQPCGRCKPPP